MAMSTAMEKIPELGRKPVALHVRLSQVKGQEQDTLSPGLRELFRLGEFTDVALICAGRNFRAHRVVLAAQSDVFRTGLASPPASDEFQSIPYPEIRLPDVENPEAVEFMLNYIYQASDAEWKDYNPRTQEINKDVLQLAKHFNLPGLTQRAKRHLAKDITTANVVERLTICDDFDLQDLHEKILEQLTFNKKALAEVSNSPQIMWFPKLMQAMLQITAQVPDSPDVTEAKPKKKARKL